MLSARAAFFWRAGALALSLLLVLPILAIGALALSAGPEIWPHLFATVLPGMLARTLALSMGVGLLSLLIGTGTAWLTTQCEFPLRRFFTWALVLPLAMPGYISAYTYVHVFEYAGPVQSAWRAFFGFARPADYSFPEIRSLPGAVFVMSLVLYPYVFLTARAAFLKLSPHHMEAARTLGRGPWGAFWHVALPLARPALAVGVVLAVMEAINDIGAANFFGVRTLTLGIYTTWLAQGNLAGAAQIAAVMLILVFGLIIAEQKSRAAQRLGLAERRDAPWQRVELQGIARMGALIACLLPLAFGFLLPAGVLLAFALRYPEMASDESFWLAMTNTLGVAAAAAFATACLGLILAYARRQVQSRLVSGAVRMAGLGYALPGTVLGIGLLVPLTGFDNWLSQWLGTGLLLSGSLFAVMLGYAIRFLAIASGNVETGLERVTPNLTAAARTLGRGPWATLLHVHLPLLRPAIGSALLLVFVDCMKELPATLILRPFDFETLATLVYQLASLEQLEQSALPALAIVAAGVLPVILISRQMGRAR